MKIWKVNLVNSDDKKTYTRYINADEGDEAGKTAFNEVGFACDDISVEHVKKAGKNSVLPAELAEIKKHEAVMQAKLDENDKISHNLTVMGWVLIAISFIGWILCFKLGMNNGHRVDAHTGNVLWMVAYSMCFLAYFGVNRLYYAEAYKDTQSIPVFYFITPALFAIPVMSLWNVIVGFRESASITWEARKYAMFASIPWVILVIFCWCVPVFQPDTRMGGYIANPQLLGIGFTVAAIPSFLIAAWLGWEYFHHNDMPNWYKPTFWGIWFWALLPAIIWFFFCRGGSKKKQEEN